ncbi:type II secretion system protein [Kamptonema cortianum]|nr:type II secretion system protein [Geitlerinema splendidum]MDK3156936.1 type II secretion system protein [Kamptonema cortianum]
MVRKVKKAFTLIELIVVMAITAILLSIIAIPVVQSFNLTRSAQGFSNAQNRARLLISQIEREISNSAAVRDNTGWRGSLVVTVPDSNGAPVQVSLSYVKLDFFKPAAGDPSARVGTAYIDPDTGRVDPTLSAPKGQANLPGVAGEVLVRYFIARRDPFAQYNNPFAIFERSPGTDWLPFNSNQDNLYVLYRAEVPVYVWRNVGGTPTRVINSDFFVDGDRDSDPNTVGPVLDDPTFMDPFAWASANLNYVVNQPWDPADRNEMVRNWLTKASIVTELSRFDMIMPIYNKQNQLVQFQGTIPSIVPLVRFQPTRINSEAATAQLAIRPGEETVNADKIGPDVYQTPYGSWAEAFLRIWPSAFNPGTGPAANSAGAVRAPWNGSDPIIDMVENAANDTVLVSSMGTTFNISLFRRLQAANAPYPFYNALEPALRPGGAASAADRAAFMAVVPEPKVGRVNAGFDIRDFGQDAGVAYEERIPSTDATAPGVQPGPLALPTDPLYQGGAAWNTYTTINERFARLWNQWDSLWPVGSAPSKSGPNGVKRYIYLGDTPQFGPTLTPSPLTPGLFPRVSIVPGSEAVYGPDQMPGPHYGKLVRYTRVPNVDTVAVGPNQYKINYTDLQEPDWSVVMPGSSPNYDKRVYNPNDFLSAVMQVRYRAGYIELNSRFGEPIPAAGPGGNIFVTYRFQFTEPNDVLAVDYDTTELMEVVLTIRNYPQTSLPNPQMITVRGSAAVRNKVR